MTQSGDIFEMSTHTFSVACPSSLFCD